MSAALSSADRSIAGRLKASFACIPGSSGLQRIFVSAGWLMVGHASRMMIGLVVGLYVARYLGPWDYGLLSYAISFSLLFVAVAHFGLTDIVVRNLVTAPGSARETLSATMGLRLASGGLAVALATGAGWLLHGDPAVRLMIMVIAAGLLLEALDVFTPWFRAQVEAKPTVVAGLVAMAAASLARIVFIVLEMPVEWFAWAVLSDALVRLGVLLLLYRRSDGPRLRRSDLGLLRMRDLLVQAWPMALSAGLILVQQRTDQVMLGMLRTPSDVGWYAAAAKLSEVWYFVPYAIVTSVFPAVVRAREASVELYEHRLSLLFGWMLWGAFAIAAGAAILAGPIVRILFGSAYTESAAVLQIHCWTIPMVALATIWNRWMVAEHFHRTAMCFTMVALGANVVLNAALIPALGAQGAALATLVAFLVPMVLYFSLGRTRPIALLMVRSVSIPPVLSVSWLRNSRLAS